MESDQFQELLADASIRPRLLARGDESTTRMRNYNRTRFNSATPACAWRHQRREISSDQLQGFNSATPACAWRRRAKPLLEHLDAELQFGHACLRVETLRNALAVEAAHSFNSATPACAWRLKPLQSCKAIMLVLQFGHACLRVET